MSSISLFVSSASPDLQWEQQAARKAIQNFTKNQFAALQETRDLRQAQVFIGLLGKGSVSPSFAADYTQAQRQGLPCFTYLQSAALSAETSATTTVPPDAQPFKSERVEGLSEAALLLKLKQETRLNTYHDLSDLEARIHGDLQRWGFDEYLPSRWQAAVENKLPKAQAQALLDAIKDQRLLSASWRNQLKAAGFAVQSDEQRGSWLPHFGMRVFAGSGKTLIGIILGLGIGLWLLLRDTGQEEPLKPTPTPTATNTQATSPPEATPSVTPSTLPSAAISPTAKPTPTPKPSVSPTAKASPSLTPKPTAIPTPTPIAPRIAISPPNVRFVLPGEQTITLANYEFDRIVISDVRFQQENPSFSIRETNCRNKTLSRNEKCQVVIRYAPPPGTTTPSTAQIVIEHDGTQKSLAIGSSTPSNAISHNVTRSTTSLEFGQVRVQSSSAPRPLTLTNQGTSSVQIRSVKIPGGRFGFGRPPFKAEQSCEGVTLAPGASCTINVTFTPENVGNQQASLEIKIRPAGSARDVGLNRVSLGGAGVR
jgi:hypothetical protein